MERKSKVLAMRILVNLCRLLLAATFIFSGFVKANDPWGMVYKFQDYLAAINLNVLPEMFLLCSAVLLALFEFLLGVNILFCISKRMTIGLTTIFMTAMTLLTVYIFIANPVSDCGCFGDVIVLSNGATLAKNIVLMAAVIAVAKWENLLFDKIPETIKGLIPLVAFLGILSYALFCIIRLPYYDSRPYKVGLNLREAMEGVSVQYDVKIVYEKNGKQLELSLDDEDPDSSWTYVETRRTEIASQGVETADFYVANADDEDITEDIIYADGITMLLVIPDLTNADEGCIDVVNNLYDWSQEEGANFYCLTASFEKEAQEYWRNHTGAEYEFYLADDRLLKTIVRGKPGLVLLNDGVIVGKWSNFNLPNEEEWNQIVAGLNGENKKQ